MYLYNDEGKKNQSLPETRVDRKLLEVWQEEEEENTTDR